MKLLCDRCFRVQFSYLAFLLFTHFPSALLAADLSQFEPALENPGRPAEDRARDATRKAPQILQFVGVQAGMTVLELQAGRGWYTEVLSYAVGAEGKIYMQFPYGAAYTEANEIRAQRLGNVELWEIPVFAIPNGTVDLVFTALNLHDIYYADSKLLDEILLALNKILKPGGILTVIDHRGIPEFDNAGMHRIDFESAVNVILKHGFHLVASSDLLHNSADDHSLPITDPILGRNTDRFVLKFAKPNN